MEVENFVATSCTQKTLKAMETQKREDSGSEFVSSEANPWAKPKKEQEIA